MRKFFFTLFILPLTVSVFAQALFNNNGADVYVKDGAFVIVKTNSLYNNVNGGAGFIDNAGTVVVEGNVTNDGSITGTGDTIRLTGNWVNNNAYLGTNSWVEMNGGAQQITGSAVTTFNNLSLQGGNVVKRQTINAITSGTLVLNNAELATDVNEMLVTNPNIGAVTRNNGFVSSVGAGRLSRATNTTSAYLFPTGSPSYNNPPSIFRPIEKTPDASAPNTFGTMVVKGDATADGYDVAVTDELLCKVNPNFYHRLYHDAGSNNVSLRMYFDPASDGNWTDEAHWDSPNRWNALGAATPGSGFGLSSINVAGVSDFLPEPFALARRKFTVNAGPDVAITLGESTAFNPSYSAASVASFLWTPAATLSCDNCENPDATPTVTTQYTLIVTDDAGCVVSDSLLVKVTVPELLIPTAFSPNGDGMNDKFRVLNKDLEQLTFQVYNRWGELVFETSTPGDGWDGIYKGVEQEMGVYVWHCQYRLTGQAQVKLAKGNMTLMR
ncbi:MAG: gliding motility-associated C-terminal domain-containing protein [Bacteroidetes bacterium]|nr:gliding motility-associated C-terminal domain-containing protein [Bacteroidota bacterium]